MATTTARDGITTVNECLMAAFNAGNAAAVAACYTTTGLLMPPRTEAIVGREGIEAYWQGAMDMGIATLQVETIEVVDYGASAVEVGRYALASADAQAIDRGKYIIVWQQEDGEWRLARDIWNSSVAPPGA